MSDCNVQWKIVSSIAHLGYELREIKMLLYKANNIHILWNTFLCLFNCGIFKRGRKIHHSPLRWLDLDLAFSLRGAPDHCNVLVLQACWESEHAGGLLPCMASVCLVVKPWCTLSHCLSFLKPDLLQMNLLKLTKMIVVYQRTKNKFIRNGLSQHLWWSS